MNAVLVLTHNNLDLTKRCIDSILKQNIPTLAYVFDNGSNDGTVEWLQGSHRSKIYPVLCQDNAGVSYGWNCGLRHIFCLKHVEAALVVGNDTWLAPWTYSALLSCNVPFVTGVAVGSMEQIPEKPDIQPLTPNPDFSCFLVRREAWEKIGPFDEQFFNYCGDCDWHIRAHKIGMPLWKASVPYWHPEPSSTTKKAGAGEYKALMERAHLDREAFKSKYGVLPGTKEYEAIFK
jgi:GT2 family glycosyltransferase